MSIFTSETMLDKEIKHFQEVLGIVDDGNVVSEDDFENSYTVSYGELLEGSV